MNVQIISYRNLENDKIQFHPLSNKILFDNKNLLIQTCIFNEYEIINTKTYKYLSISIDENNQKILNFFNKMLEIESKFNLKFIKDNLDIDIHENKFLKIIINNDTIFYDKNDYEIDKLSEKKIIMLIDIYKNILKSVEVKEI